MTKKKQTYTRFISFLNTGIFPGTILFAYRYSYDELYTHLKKTKATDWHRGIETDKKLIDSGNYFALHRDIEYLKTGRKVTLMYIIINKEFKFSDYEFCKLAHEALHICQFFLKDILDRNKEFEAEAYLHTHIMDQCIIELRKNIK